MAKKVAEFEFKYLKDTLDNFSKEFEDANNKIKKFETKEKTKEFFYLTLKIKWIEEKYNFYLTQYKKCKREIGYLENTYTITIVK